MTKVLSRFESDSISWRQQHIYSVIYRCKLIQRHRVCVEHKYISNLVRLRLRKIPQLRQILQWFSVEIFIQIMTPVFQMYFFSDCYILNGLWGMSVKELLQYFPSAK